MVKSSKRKFKEIIYATVPETEASSSQTVDGNDGAGEDAPAGEDAAGSAPEAGAAAQAAPAELEAGAGGAAVPCLPRRQLARQARPQAIPVRPRRQCPPKRPLPRGGRGWGGDKNEVICA